MDDQRPISFVGTTAANDSTEQKHEFEAPGTITAATVITHSGQEYALRNYAYLLRGGSRTSLWETLDEDYLAGDGEDYETSLRFEFEKGDELLLRAENTSSYDYHHNMLISVDYETGTFDRVAAGIRRVV